MFALKLFNDSRIQYATFEKYAVKGMPIVDKLPDGNVIDYKYIDGEYIYDPLPQPEPPEPRPTVEQNRADIDYIAMMTDVDLDVEAE